jgi:hypothetical protein
MFSIFQDASGNLHWPSTLAAIGWVVAGVLLFVNLWFGKLDRDKSGPWKINEEQKQVFSTYLQKARKGKVAVEYSASDHVRAHAFATIVKEMLEKGGYDVWGYMPTFQQTGSAPPRVGIFIGAKPIAKANAEHINGAFKASNILAQIVPQNNNNYEDDRAVVYIGIKP